jgi:hypothetical protein
VDSAGVFLFMSREKRTEIVRSRITPSMREQLELDLRERSNVLSISDYLFELVEERIAQRSIRVARQQIGKRIGNQ